MSIAVEALKGRPVGEMEDRPGKFTGLVEAAKNLLNIADSDWGMLVIARKPNQGLTIGGNIHVTVLAIERGRVKLGISAPDEIRIDRNELLARDQQRQDKSRTQRRSNGEPKPDSIS